MGTHIDGFFPHAIERSPDFVRTRLAVTLGGLGDDLAIIRERGRSSAGGGDWSLLRDDDGTVFGEGPSGFSIWAYPMVVEFTSVERFGAIQHRDQGIQDALRRVFEAVAAGFGGVGWFAVAAGGFGDTDEAGDLALAGARFVEICACLTAKVGPPVRSWEALEAGRGQWFLSAPAVEQSVTPFPTGGVGFEK
jgi:hypothetical protein